MELAKAALTSFVLIDADWLPERARSLIERLEPSHVIIRRTGPPEAYYLLSSDQAVHKLEQAPDSIQVGPMLQLFKLTPTPLIEGDRELSSAPVPCIVRREGLIIGFYDAGMPSLADPRTELFGRLSGLSGGRPNGASFEAATREFVPPGETSGQDAGQSLSAEFPENIALHQTASLLVSIVRGFNPGTSLVALLPQGSEIDIVVQARRGLALEGPSEGKLVVTGDVEGLPLQFRLRGTTPGPGQIRVLAFHTGRPLGLITLAPVVLESTAEVNSESMSREDTLAPATVKVPDLSLLILETKQGAEVTLSFRLSTHSTTPSYYLKPFGSIRLQSDPYAYFQDFFTDIESLPIQNAAARAASEIRLAAKGASLFEQLLPEELRDAIWHLQPQIKSMRVNSEEPCVPWELCRLWRRSTDNDGIEDGPFFCEAFQMTRWVPGLAPVSQLGFRNLALVVPDDSGLASAATERDYVISLGGASRQVTRIPATFLDVQAALASGTYDAWHFCGHGVFRNVSNPDRSAMILQGGDRLTPEDLSGRAANLGRAHPLVFLNACQLGQAGMSLTDMGGWAIRLLNAGTGVFLGACWSVYDQPALNFAKAFYTRLLAGDPVGKAAHKARLASRASGDPTWLAYTVFADPLATIAQ